MMFHNETRLLLWLLFLLVLVVGVASAHDDESSIEFVSDNKVTLNEEEEVDVVGELEEETGFYQSIAVEEEPLHEEESQYQLIEVYQSLKYYGKILVLDEVLQLTERDGASYNEMMAHVAAMAHPNPKRVLIIGGGDGFVLNELLKHSTVEHADHVELDEAVIKVCKKHFGWGKAWDDERVSLHISDGAAFVENAPDSTYDVIVQDSSDPWTLDDDGNREELPSSVLYEPKHIKNILRILTPSGVFNMQAETFNLPSDLESMISWRKQALDLGFHSARYGSVYTSSYSTGQIGFLLCQKSTKYTDSPEYSKSVEERYQQIVKRGLDTTYYHPRLQQSSFDLPKWVEDAIYAESPLEDKEL